MKVKFFCILLTLIVIILLSVSAQAKEFRKINEKVNASDILIHIEKGDDIDLYNCSVIGELNASKINKMVPNQYFLTHFTIGEAKEYDSYIYSSDEYLNKTFHIDKNLHFIQNNITIMNTTFDEEVDLSDVFFNNNVYFSYSTFNNSADFSYSIYKNVTCFSKSTFKDNAYFLHSTFNNFVDFKGSTFNDSVDFTESTFDNVADFSYSTFNSSAKLSDLTFNSLSNFSYATFNCPASFKSTFKDDVYFSYSTFNNSADFKGCTFNRPAYLWDLQFNGSADFRGVTFNDYAEFWKVQFYGSTYFSYAKFESYVNFMDSTFYNVADFRRVTFNNSDYLDVPEKSENILTDGRTCEFFRKSYNNLARYNDADNIYYNFRKQSMDEESISLTKLIDFLSWVVCGFGTKLDFTIKWIIGIIIFFTGVYRTGPKIFYDIHEIFWPTNMKIPLRFKFQGPIIYRSLFKEDKTEKSTVSTLECLAFSINTFTRLGTPDWHQRDKFWYAVTIEGVLGWIMLAIFLATFIHLLIRP